MTVTGVSTSCCGFYSCGEFADYMLDTTVKIAAVATTSLCLTAIAILCCPITISIAVDLACADDTARITDDLINCAKEICEYVVVFFRFVTMPIAIGIKMCFSSSCWIHPVSIPGVKQETITVDPKGEEIGLPEGATFVLNESKCFSFDSMINALNIPKFLSVQTRLSLWDETDFIDPALKGKILNTAKFQEVGYSNCGEQIDNKICLYTHVLLDLLCKYKKIAEEEGIVDTYREHFTGIMREVSHTFFTGCERNRIGALPYIIADTINLHPRLLGELGIDSPVQTRFALNLYQYQKQEARQLAYKSGHDEADFELEVLKKLGIVKADYYDNRYNVVNGFAVAIDKFKQNYLPLQFFIENLTEPAEAGKLTTQFHTDMLKWYSDQGIDFETETTGVYQVNKNAVIYFLWKNDLLRLVQ